MASVRINSGPPEAEDRPSHISKEKWKDLMWVKRDFLKTRVKYDCRCLLDFIEDAEEMWEELGYESKEDMVLLGYELNPEEVDLAIKWLKIKDPNEAVKYEVAVAEGKKLGDWGTNRFTDRGVYNTSTIERGTTNRDYILARLARDRPDILEDYGNGIYKSARQAAIAAGIIKVPTPYETAVKAIRKLNREDQERLFNEILGERGCPIE